MNERLPIDEALESVVADAVTDGYSKQFHDYVKFGTTRPTHDSLEAAAIAVRKPGAGPRTLFSKPNKMPRAFRNQIANAQRANNMMFFEFVDKAERDKTYQEMKAQGQRGLTKYSTGKTIDIETECVYCVEEPDHIATDCMCKGTRKIRGVESCTMWVVAWPRS